MKVDSVQCLKCAGSVVLAVVGAFLLWMMAMPARAASPDGFGEGEFEAFCKESVCIVERAQLEWLMRSNNKLGERLKEAEASAKAPPRCAEVEVTEPSKAPKPKPIPPIKRENDT